VVLTSQSKLNLELTVVFEYLKSVYGLPGTKFSELTGAAVKKLISYVVTGEVKDTVFELII
jgi:hypothetical protein